jgi:hypothetical protein
MNRRELLRTGLYGMAVVQAPHESHRHSRARRHLPRKPPAIREY